MYNRVELTPNGENMSVPFRLTSVALATLAWLPAGSSPALMPIVQQPVAQSPVDATAISSLAAAIVPMTKDVLAQAAPTEAEREQRILEGVYLNNQAWSLMGNVSYDLPTALEKFQQALAIFRQYGAKGGEANSLEGIGVVYLRQGEHQRALQYLQQALALRQTLGDKETTGHTLAYLGDVHIAMKQPVKALEVYLKALVIYREVESQLGTHSLASLLQNIAGSYFQLGQYQTALDYYQQLLPTYDRGLLRAQVLNNIGVVHINMGNYAQALQAYHTALDITVTVGNCYRQDPGSRLCLYGDEAAILNNLAAAYFNIGDYKRALEYSRRAAEIYRQSRLQGHRLPDADIPDSLESLQVLQDTLGQNSRALTALSQELTARASVGTFFTTDPTRFSRLDPDIVSNEALSLNGLAQVYAYLGNYEQAIDLYKKAREIYREIKAPIGEGVVLNNIGNVYVRNGQYPQAIDTYQQALAIHRTIGDRAGEANTLNNIGSAYRQLKQTQNAVELYGKALTIYRQVGNRAGEATALSNLGQVYAQQQQYSEAERRLREAVQVFDGLRSQLKDTEKIALLDTQRATYNALQQILVAQNQPERALEIAERGRARAFVDLLASRLQTRQLPPAPQLSASPTASPVPSIRAKDSGQAVQPINLSAIQQVAKDQRATLVEYSIVSPETLYIWVIKPTGDVVFQSVALPPASNGVSALRRLVDASRAEDLSAQGRGLTFVEDLTVVAQVNPQRQPSSSDTYAHLKQLHRLLIAPIAAHLPSNPNDRVIIIPQEELFLVPFAALPNAQGIFLIEAHTLTTAPAIQVLQLTHSRVVDYRSRCRADSPSATCAPRSAPLIVGNPTMPKIGNPPQHLTSLPGAEAEAKTIAQLLNTQPLIGTQASKAIVTQQMATARLIHFATHGLLDDFKGLGVPGAIALAPDSSPSTDRQQTPSTEQTRATNAPSVAPSPLPIIPDGLLTANEILDMSLSADLVVLSACDTGRGRVTGDGVVGLSRSLISAGVPSVVVSLWKVADDSTNFLMTQFYTNLLQSQTNKAQALRQAILTTKQQYPSPKDWAAFTLIGEAE